MRNTGARTHSRLEPDGNMIQAWIELKSEVQGITSRFKRSSLADENRFV